MRVLTLARRLLFAAAVMKQENQSMRSRTGITVATALALCSGCIEMEEEDVESTGEAISQGVPGNEAANPFLSGVIRYRGCTGTLVAPDVVVTAAHCLD